MLRLSILAIALSMLLATYLPIKYIHKGLIPYDSSFTKHIQELCPKYTNNKQKYIIFDNLPKGTLGICYNNSYRFILVIDRQYWINTTNSQRNSLFAHESTHCYLNMMEHSPDPYNYMYFTENFLTEQELKEQVDNNIKEYCSHIK